MYTAFLWFWFILKHFYKIYLSTNMCIIIFNYLPCHILWDRESSTVVFSSIILISSSPLSSSLVKSWYVLLYKLISCQHPFFFFIIQYSVLELTGRVTYWWCTRLYNLVIHHDFRYCTQRKLVSNSLPFCVSLQFCCFWFFRCFKNFFRSAIVSINPLTRSMDISVLIASSFFWFSKSSSNLWIKKS